MMEIWKGNNKVFIGEVWQQNGRKKYLLLILLDVMLLVLF